MKVLARALKKGDTIGIIAPSAPGTEYQLKLLSNFEEYMRQQGFSIKRADRLEKSAVFGIAGGTPTNQLLPLLDYDIIKNNPKIFVGKSDIDVLSLAINKYTGLITFHGCDSKLGDDKEMDFDYTKKWLKKRFMDGNKEIEPSEDWTTIRPGSAEGKIMGCNITSIQKLAGTNYFPDFSESILFLESLNLDVRNLVWKLTHLDQLGIFSNVHGIVIGNNYGFEPGPDNYSVEEIVKELTEKYGFSILKISEFGHYQPHAFLPIGAQVSVDATNKKIMIKEDFIFTT